MQRASLFIALLIGLALSAGVALAETVYVQAKTAKLRAGKTSLDAVVADLKFGETLEVLDRKSTRLNSSHIQKSRMPSSA